MKALALVEAPDHVCGRYRIEAFRSALDAAGWSLDVQGIASGAIARVRQFRAAVGYDTVILQRKLPPSWQVAILRARSKRLIFDFDDAVLYRDSYRSRGPHSRRRAARFGRVVKAADLVLAGNGFLAGCAAVHGAGRDRVRVIPTCIDVDRYAPRQDPPGRDVIVRLVWVGSSSTLRGIENQRPMLERLGHEIPNLRLRIISDRFPRFDPLPIEPVPWSEAGEATAIAGGDIGISWVPDDLWSRGKCGLKILQYGAAGLPTVTNPVGVHAEMVVPGRSGYLPRTEDDWVGAIQKLAGDPVRRRLMGNEARKTVEGDYSVRAWSGAFVGAISGANHGIFSGIKTASAGKAVAR